VIQLIPRDYDHQVFVLGAQVADDSEITFAVFGREKGVQGSSPAYASVVSPGPATRTNPTGRASLATNVRRSSFNVRRRADDHLTTTS
jgi:hypothetical protein